MSSASDFASDSCIPRSQPACMFTIEQFRQGASYQSAKPECSHVYIVRPTAIWDSLERLRTVIIEKDDEEESYTLQLNDTVAITRHDLPSSPLWTAHILEFRGHKPTSQVFIRLYYFYQPSQLPPSLRQDYHGRHEVIASNSMAVIDATAVVSRTHVSHWHEEQDLLPAAGLFWRQTYNVLSQDLSPLPTPCHSCPHPQNPDDPLIQCPLPVCFARMHKSCILSAVHSRLQAEAETQAQAEAAKTKKRAKKKAKNAKTAPSLKVEWVDGGPEEGFGAQITEPGGHFWVEDVYCLGCWGLMR